MLIARALGIQALVLALVAYFENAIMQTSPLDVAWVYGLSTFVTCANTFAAFCEDRLAAHPWSSPIMPSDTTRGDVIAFAVTLHSTAIIQGAVTLYFQQLPQGFGVLVGMCAAFLAWVCFWLISSAIAALLSAVSGRSIEQHGQ